MSEAAGFARVQCSESEAGGSERADVVEEIRPRGATSRYTHEMNNVYLFIYLFYVLLSIYFCTCIIYLSLHVMFFYYLFNVLFLFIYLFSDIIIIKGED